MLNRRKVERFLELSFPPYSNCTIVAEREDSTIAVLEYSKHDKIKVTVGLDGDGQNLYKLLQTDFI